MCELDIIRDLAKQALTITTPTGDIDSFLWDRGQRLVCNVEHICRLIEAAKTNFQIDHFCLKVATYFSDAGLARSLQSPKNKSSTIESDIDFRGIYGYSAEFHFFRLGI